MTPPVLLALPWLGVLAFLLFAVRLPRALPAPAVRAMEGSGRTRGGQPSVSVIVPARDEAANIETCLGSLAAMEYGDFEIIVVDDRSSDGTGALARGVAAGRARSLRVIDGSELPGEWLGKPWACHQGAAVATGELLLFTDADTRHGPALLARAVAGLEEDGADLLTVVGRQLMESFWERLVQPQVFMTMLFRFPDVERLIARGRWRDAIANGQYMLFRRDAYDALGGHEAVRDEVVEDLALAQRGVRKGRRLSLRMAEDDFATRMYRSLGHLVEGWSKNIVLGGLQSVPPWARPIVPPLSLTLGVGLWLAPPLALLGGAVGLASTSVAAWGAAATGLSVLHWALLTHRMGVPAWYGALYPLGAAVGTYIFVRSWAGGRNVEWKGRRYRVPDLAERP